MSKTLGRTGLLLTLLSVSLLASCTRGHAEQGNFNPQNPPLEATSMFRDNYEQQVVFGNVRNVSGERIANVQAVVEFLSATDRVIDIRINALGELAPNQTVDFTLSHEEQYGSVGVTHHRLRFRFRESGRAIPFRDASGTMTARPDDGYEMNYHEADPGGRHALPPVTRDEHPSQAPHAGGNHTEGAAH